MAQLLNIFALKWTCFNFKLIYRIFFFVNDEHLYDIQFYKILDSFKICNDLFGI